ncbi:hypothetical protein ASPZODRAFT_168230 [Penicilliopsis zonata CBS 506.65]|uniref:Histidine acid phosphatase n=1 Tax=Penicilliopsis zonata CBS 506.65 TaxID=1073090 RepID=A0A1L9SD76_9EURO|nr:hypothetical protein ASPZODRAFT_168230 [Penicilliopsis zonata CBS 506.65]OJJ45175.1 hypothetical protein ASPZODRAFT_168230 [Penicilliopsis zonata CBS 506.65]
MILPLLALAAPAYAVSAVDSFYPPNIEDLSWITNGSLGTYGGLYSAPASAASEPSPYGAYDYCSMPHPRAQEYVLPAPVQNGSVKAQLVYLEYLQRHQRRTPYNILPGGENEEYHCDDILPYLYAGPASSTAQQPLRVYAKTYSDPANPFLDDYVNGTCQYPQLTIGGLLDGYQHGRDLWAVYGDRLGFLPRTPEDGRRVWFRSSSSALTQDSAGGVLRGLWPHYSGAVPLHQQAASVDTVNEGYSCAAEDTVLDAIEASDEWEAHLAATASLRDDLATMFDANTSAWMSTYDHFSDNFQARLCNGYELPCSRANLSECVTQAQAEEIFRAGDWMWDYWYRASANATSYITLLEGLFIGEIVNRLQAVADSKGEQTLQYSHNFIHDGDIGPVLGALGIKALRWPGMGSNIAFEIWKTEDDLFSRVLYSGHPLQTTHGMLEWVSLADLIAILQPFVPDDIITLCNA